MYYKIDRSNITSQYLCINLAERFRSETAAEKHRLKPAVVYTEHTGSAFICGSWSNQNIQTIILDIVFFSFFICRYKLELQVLYFSIGFSLKCSRLDLIHI